MARDGTAVQRKPQSILVGRIKHMSPQLAVQHTTIRLTVLPRQVEAEGLLLRSLCLKLNQNNSPYIISNLMIFNSGMVDLSYSSQKKNMHILYVNIRFLHSFYLLEISSHNNFLTYI